MSANDIPLLQASKFTVKIGGTDLQVTTTSGIGASLGPVPMTTSSATRVEKTRAGNPSWQPISITRPYVMDGTDGSMLEDWFKACLDNPTAKDTALKEVVVELVDHDEAVVKSWTFNDCWISNWSILDFSAGSDETLTETGVIEVNEWATLLQR